MRPIHEMTDEEFDALVAADDLELLKASRDQLNGDITEFTSKLDALQAAASLLDEQIAREKARSREAESSADVGSAEDEGVLYEDVVGDDLEYQEPESFLQRLVRTVIEKVRHFLRLPESNGRESQSYEQEYYDVEAGRNYGVTEDPAANIEQKDELTEGAITNAEADLAASLGKQQQRPPRVVDIAKADDRLREIARQHQQIFARLSVLHKRLEIINERIEEIEAARNQMVARPHSERENAELPDNVIRVGVADDTSSARITS